MTMKMSDRGVVALALHEGIVPAPYRDSVGRLTWGIGHTSAAGAPDPASLPMAMPPDLDAALVEVFRVFRRDLAAYEDETRRAITRPVSQHQFDAAVSFHFHTGAIGTATWVQTLNAGREAQAAKEIMNWSKPAEIIPRRMAEQRMFRDGDYPTGMVPVWQTDGKGRVIWKPVMQLAPEEALFFLRPVQPTPKPTLPITDKLPQVSGGVLAAIGAAIVAALAYIALGGN